MQDDGERLILHLAGLAPALLLAVTPALAQEGDAIPDWATQPIPEPLLFDIALPLDTPRGQFEVNSIFRFPTGDGEIVSAPEIEGTLLDGLSFELELEFEGSQRVAWSAAGQLTFGRASKQRFVHGGQLIVERDDSKRRTELVALYMPGYRFSRVWSALLMVGARSVVSGEGDTRFITNGSVFAELADAWCLGLELNYRADIRRSESLEVIPQLHWRSGRHFALQAGVGFGEDDESTKTELILRAIYAF